MAEPTGFDRGGAACPRCHNAVAPTDTSCPRCGFVPAPPPYDVRPARGQTSVAGTSFTWPIPDKQVRVAGRALPVELVGVSAVYAFAGAWLLLEARSLVSTIPDLLSTLFGGGAFAFALASVFLIVTAVILYVVVALLAVAYLVLRRDPVGRGLSVVVFATLVAVMATSGSGVPGGFVLIVLVAGVCSASLFVSPWSRRAFAQSARGRGRPSSIVLSQTLSVSYLSVMSLMVLLLIPGLRFVGDLGAGYVLFELATAAACTVGWLGYRGLRRGPERTARVQVTVAAGAFLVGLLIGFSDTSIFPIPLAILVSVVAPLWLAPHARQAFGDHPVNLLA
ncbi:MAG: hypothetical protein ACRDQA_21575 [Nocardioidaceae bacterium]